MQIASRRSLLRSEDDTLVTCYARDDCYATHGPFATTIAWIGNVLRTRVDWVLSVVCCDIDWFTGDSCQGIRSSDMFIPPSLMLLRNPSGKENG